MKRKLFLLTLVICLILISIVVFVSCNKETKEKAIINGLSNEEVLSLADDSGYDDYLENHVILKYLTKEFSDRSSYYYIELNQFIIFYKYDSSISKYNCVVYSLLKDKEIFIGNVADYNNIIFGINYSTTYFYATESKDAYIKLLSVPEYVSSSKTLVHLYDVMGNQIYSFDDSINIEEKAIELIYYNTEYYITVEFNNLDNNQKETKTLRTYGYPSAYGSYCWLKDYNKEEKEEYEPKSIGEMLDVRSNYYLSSKVFKDYKLKRIVFDEYVEFTIYDLNENIVSTYIVPIDFNSVEFVGQKLILKYEYDVSDNETYLYYDSTSKCGKIIEYYLLDMITGESKALDFNYYWESATVIESKTEIDGVEYIDNDKIVVTAYEYKNNSIYKGITHYLAIDRNGNINDITGAYYKYKDLIKLSDSRYLINNSNGYKIIDNELNEIASIDIFGLSIQYEHGLIVGSIYDENTDKEYYGAVDFDGKIRIPFVYSSTLATNISDAIPNGVVVATSLIDNKSYLVNLISGIQLEPNGYSADNKVYVSHFIYGMEKQTLIEKEGETYVDWSITYYDGSSERHLINASYFGTKIIKIYVVPFTDVTLYKINYSDVYNSTSSNILSNTIYIISYIENNANY